MVITKNRANIVGRFHNCSDTFGRPGLATKSSETLLLMNFAKNFYEVNMRHCLN